MKTTFRLLIILGLVLHLLSSQVYAGSEHIIRRNTLKANEYISQLQDGANPDTITRPYLIRHHKYKVKRNARKLNKILDNAEALSRSGRSDLIQQISSPDTVK